MVSANLLSKKQLNIFYFSRKLKRDSVRNKERSVSEIIKQKSFVNLIFILFSSKTPVCERIWNMGGC